MAGRCAWVFAVSDGWALALHASRHGMYISSGGRLGACERMLSLNARRAVSRAVVVSDLLSRLLGSFCQHPACHWLLQTSCSFCQHPACHAIVQVTEVDRQYRQIGEAGASPVCLANRAAAQTTTCAGAAIALLAKSQQPQLTWRLHPASLQPRSRPAPHRGPSQRAAHPGGLNLF